MKRHRYVPELLPLALFFAVTQGQSATAEEPERKLTGMIGFGVSSAPLFSGSDKTSTGVFPIIDLTWSDRYFVNEHGLGFYALRDFGPGDLSLSLAIGYDFDERLAEDDTRLTGLKDVEAGTIVSAMLEYDAGFADLELELNHGLSNDGHKGTRATFAAEFAKPIGKRARVSANPFLTWADGSYNSAFYGVTAREATRSSFQAFDAGAGLQRVGLELQTSYRLTSRSGIFLSVEYSRLIGDAKDSPITFDDTQTSISSGVFYRF